MDVFCQRILDEGAPLVFLPAFERGEYPGFAQGGGGNVVGRMIAADDHVRARSLGRMQPVIVGGGHFERQRIPLGAAPAQHEESVAAAEGLHLGRHARGKVACPYRSGRSLGRRTGNGGTHAENGLFRAHFFFEHGVAPPGKMLQPSFAASSLMEKIRHVFAQRALLIEGQHDIPFRPVQRDGSQVSGLIEEIELALQKQRAFLLFPHGGEAALFVIELFEQPAQPGAFRKERLGGVLPGTLRQIPEDDLFTGFFHGRGRVGKNGLPPAFLSQRRHRPCRNGASVPVLVKEYVAAPHAQVHEQGRGVSGIHGGKLAAKRRGEHCPFPPSVRRILQDGGVRPGGIGKGDRRIERKGCSLAQVELQPCCAAGKAQPQAALRPFADCIFHMLPRKVLAQAHDIGRRLGIDRDMAGSREDEGMLTTMPEDQAAPAIFTPSAKQAEAQNVVRRGVYLFHARPGEPGQDRIAEAPEKVRIHGISCRVWLRLLPGAPCRRRKGWSRDAP